MTVEKTFLEMVTKTRSSQVIKIWVKNGIKSFDGVSKYLDTLKSASSNDVVDMYINSTGGHMSMAIDLVDAMNECKAKITTHAIGKVASAATFIFLAGDVRVIHDSSYFMFHQYSHSASGKGDDTLQKTKFLKKHYKKFFKKYYDEVLTKKELEKLLDGKDLYLSGEEVEERIKKEK